MPNGPTPYHAVTHDRWSAWAERDMARVRRALGADCHAIHHVGSTSVLPRPGLPSTKAPVIDIAAEVRGPALPEPALLRLLVHGFIVQEAEPACRLFVVEDPATGDRRVELRCYPAGHAEVRVLVAFYAYLRRTPDAADEYREMKHQTRLSHGASTPAYLAAKRAWIERRHAAASQVLRLA